MNNKVYSKNLLVLKLQFKKTLLTSMNKQY